MPDNQKPDANNPEQASPKNFSLSELSLNDRNIIIIFSLKYLDDDNLKGLISAAVPENLLNLALNPEIFKAVFKEVYIRSKQKEIISFLYLIEGMFKAYCHYSSKKYNLLDLMYYVTSHDFNAIKKNSLNNILQRDIDIWEMALQHSKNNRPLSLQVATYSAKKYESRMLSEKFIPFYAVSSNQERVKQLLAIIPVLRYAPVNSDPSEYAKLKWSLIYSCEALTKYGQNEPNISFVYLLLGGPVKKYKKNEIQFLLSKYWHVDAQLRITLQTELIDLLAKLIIEMPKTIDFIFREHGENTKHIAAWYRGRKDEAKEYLVLITQVFLQLPPLLQDSLIEKLIQNLINHYESYDFYQLNILVVMFLEHNAKVLTADHWNKILLSFPGILNHQTIYSIAPLYDLLFAHRSQFSSSQLQQLDSCFFSNLHNCTSQCRHSELELLSVIMQNIAIFVEHDLIRYINFSKIFDETVHKSFNFINKALTDYDLTPLLEHLDDVQLIQLLCLICQYSTVDSQRTNANLTEKQKIELDHLAVMIISKCSNGLCLQMFSAAFAGICNHEESSLAHGFKTCNSILLNNKVDHTILNVLYTKSDFINKNQIDVNNYVVDIVIALENQKNIDDSFPEPIGRVIQLFWSTFTSQNKQLILKKIKSILSAQLNVLPQNLDVNKTVLKNCILVAEICDATELATIIDHSNLDKLFMNAPQIKLLDKLLRLVLARGSIEILSNLFTLLNMRVYVLESYVYLFEILNSPVINDENYVLALKHVISIHERTDSLDATYPSLNAALLLQLPKMMRIAQDQVHNWIEQLHSRMLQQRISITCAKYLAHILQQTGIKIPAEKIAELRSNFQHAKFFFNYLSDVVEAKSSLDDIVALQIVLQTRLLPEPEPDPLLSDIFEQYNAALSAEVSEEVEMDLLNNATKRMRLR